MARIYESVELNEEGTEVVESKKFHKYDRAFYSKMSMSINGGEEDNGILNINAENEGLGTELHLTINGGTVIATENMLEHISESEQGYVVFNFQDKVREEKITLENQNIKSKKAVLLEAI